MAAENNTNKIRELERQMATLVERVDYLRRDIDRGDQKVEEMARAARDLEQRQSLLTSRVEGIEKARDEGHLRRWDLWKLILAAFLGGVLTLASGFIGRWLDRLIVPQHRQAGPSRPSS